MPHSLFKLNRILLVEFRLTPILLKVAFSPSNLTLPIDRMVVLGLGGTLALKTSCAWARAEPPD